MPTAISIDDHAQLRRWAISSALVVAVHAAIVAAALSWRFAIAPLDTPSMPPAGPLLIDLAPLAAPSSSTQSEPAPAEGAGRPAAAAMSAPTPAPTQPAKRVGAEEATVKGSENALPPAALMPAEPIDGQGSAEARTSSGGGVAAQQPAPSSDLGRARADTSSTVSSPAPSTAASSTPAPSTPASSIAEPSTPAASTPAVTLRVDPGPLDTSITVQPPLYGRKPGGMFAVPKFGLVRPMGPMPPMSPGSAANGRVPSFHIPGTHIFGRFGRADVRGDEPAKTVRPAEGLRSPIGGVRNAIGGAAPARLGEAARPVGEARNAVGSAAGNGRGLGGLGLGLGSTASTVSHTAINAIGMAVHVNPRSFGEAKTDPIGTTHSSPTAAIINGNSMVRPGARTGVIGGPTRTAQSGVISGTDFHARRR